MVSYQADKKNIEDDHIVICLNSLLMYSRYKPEFFKNYIVYIDEINTFTRHLTHNATLNSNLKLVYITLMKIINNCHKLIGSEAIISDNVFNLLSNRPNENKIFIENSFKKYQDIEAIKHNDENEFLEYILSNVTNKEYFLFGCDSKTIITKYYKECLKIDSENCILITSEDKFELNDVKTQFKNKYVFYSPSITCGLNFDIDIKQNVFLYINGQTLEPCDSFQQSTRTRNIKKLHYYINKSRTTYKPIHINLNETSLYYKDIKNIHNDKNDKIENLTNICLSIDENNNTKFNENTFFNLFIYNSYLTDVYKTNKEYHFKEILKINGYTLSEVDQIRPKKLTQEKQQELNDGLLEFTDKKFNDHIDEIKPDEMIENNINFLKVNDKEDQIKYKDVINDNHLLKNYLNLIRLFYSDNEINIKLSQLNKNNVEYKTIFSDYNKIKLLKELETEAKINRFDIEHKEQDEDINISDNLYNKIKISFRSKEIKPLTYNAFINYYVMKIKHILGNIILIDKNKVQINKKRIMRYSINKDILKHYMDLNYLSNNTKWNFNPYLIEKYKDIILIANDDEFKDDEDIDDDIDSVDTYNPLD
jgi:hypothetical protein